MLFYSLPWRIDLLFETVLALEYVNKIADSSPFLTAFESVGSKNTGMGENSIGATGLTAWLLISLEAKEYVFFVELIIQRNILGWLVESNITLCKYTLQSKWIFDFVIIVVSTNFLYEILLSTLKIYTYAKAV